MKLCFVNSLAFERNDTHKLFAFTILVGILLKMAHTPLTSIHKIQPTNTLRKEKCLHRIVFALPMPKIVFNQLNT